MVLKRNGLGVMVFNATFNNISVISWRSAFWWRKPEYPKKTTNLKKGEGKDKEIPSQSK
jgi:hypothetical protein